MNDKKETHPSYALMSFSRITSSGEIPLFGSSIKHKETIRMRVTPACIERSLHTDWYFQNGREYIEVEMSYAQFAEAITSMNMGSGVPVTLKHLNQEEIPSPEFNNKRELYETELKDKMEKINTSIRKLTDESHDILTNKKSINKGDRQIILSQIDALSREIQNNIPFMMKTFNEQMDKTVHESKSEIEAFTQNKINQLGLSKLQELSHNDFYTKELDRPNESE